MKKIIFILVIACTQFVSYGQIPQKDSMRQVIAFSGLKLRHSPDSESKVLRIIPFGERLKLIEKQDSSFLVEWLEGGWSKVRFEGEEGYVFDAFLTPLPVPVNNYELSQNDADISFPIMAWTEHNFRIEEINDTIHYNNHEKIVQHFQDGIILSRKSGEHAFQVNLVIPGIRLGDAYNLCRSLMLTRAERELFESQSVFVANNNETIDKILVDIDSPIEIRKLDDAVEIQVKSYQHVCGL